MLLWGLIWGWQVDLGRSLDVPHGGHHLHCHFCCREVGSGVEGYLSAYLEGSTLWELIRNVIGDFRHRSWGFFMLGLEVFGVRLCQTPLFFWLRDVGLALYPDLFLTLPPCLPGLRAPASNTG